jgi:hypothetical protein
VFFAQAWAQGSQWAGAMGALFVVADGTTLVRGVATQRVLDWERREF